MLIKVLECIGQTTQQDERQQHLNCRSWGVARQSKGRGVIREKLCCLGKLPVRKVPRGGPTTRIREYMRRGLRVKQVRTEYHSQFIIARLLRRMGRDETAGTVSTAFHYRVAYRTHRLARHQSLPPYVHKTCTKLPICATLSRAGIQ